MITIGNKEFRNIQEQVEKNKSDIEYILEEEGVLNEFGIRVTEQISDISELPTVEEYKEDHTGWEYGDCIAVGDEEPYELYILTRANGNHPNDYWFDLGVFPLPGPQGPQGEKGDKGDTGEQGPQGIQGIQGEQGNKGTSIYALSKNLSNTIGSYNETNKDGIDYIVGDVIIGQNGYVGKITSVGASTVIYQVISSIIGPTGARGPQGETGQQGVKGESGLSVFYCSSNLATTINSTVLTPKENIITQTEDITPVINDLIVGANGYLGYIIGIGTANYQIKTLNKIKGENGTNGTNGQDGFSPIITVTSATGGHEISITDATGTETFLVSDGTSPVVTPISNGIRVTVYDEYGSHSYDIVNGQDGTDGTDGTDGLSIYKAATGYNVKFSTTIGTSNTVTVNKIDIPSGRTIQLKDQIIDTYDTLGYVSAIDTSVTPNSLTVITSGILKGYEGYSIYKAPNKDLNTTIGYTTNLYLSDMTVPAARTVKMFDFVIGKNGYLGYVNGMNGDQYVVQTFVKMVGENGTSLINVEIVQALPATGDGNTLYFVSNGGTGTNQYDEYIYTNNAWEKLGTTSIDLTNYIQKSSTSGLVKNDGTIDTTQYSTFSGSYADLSNKPTIPAAVTANVTVPGGANDLTSLQIGSTVYNVPTYVSDVQIDSTSIVSQDVANLLTAGSNYSASSNRLTTQSDVEDSINIALNNALYPKAIPGEITYDNATMSGQVDSTTWSALMAGESEVTILESNSSGIYYDIINHLPLNYTDADIALSKLKFSEFNYPNYEMSFSATYKIVSISQTQIVVKNIDIPDDINAFGTAPSADNTTGAYKVVVLSSEPATYYNGYIYYITES